MRFGTRSLIALRGSAAAAAHVTGTETFVHATTAGTTTSVGGVSQMRGLVGEVTDAMSDPRASGTGTLTGNYDLHDGGGVQWGTYQLANAGGSWEGTWSGILYGSGPVEDCSVWLVGKGGYAGLSYYFHFHGSGGTYETDGLIFPGSPPAP